jgi:quercetin 2,3-dioxygenase
MITLRRARERYDDRRGKQEVWLSFYAQAADDRLAEGFGDLTQLDEIRLPPGGTIRAQPQRDAELITYVLDGTLTCEDALGHAGSMQAGEFRRMTVGPGVRCSETNLSRSNWTHLFQIGLRCDAAFQRAFDQKRFSVAQRRDGLCLIASKAARAGSLRIREESLVYSAILRPGQHLVHDLQEGRRAWLHVVSGEVALQDLVLRSGDGVGISAERSASFTALAEAEVLLVDVS